LSSIFSEISGKVQKSLLHPCLPAGRDYETITQIRNTPIQPGCGSRRRGEKAGIASFYVFTEG
jgi:hypothetical protein